MSQELSCAELRARLRSADPGAQTQVFDQYMRRLIGLARKRLKRQVVTSIGADAVAASAFLSFFTKHTEDEVELRNEDCLWCLLAKITLRHCEKWNKRFRAGKRKATVVPLGSDMESAGVAEPADDRHTVEDEVIFTDYCEELNEQLTESQRKIVDLRLEGWTTKQIADALQIAVTTVNRKLGLIKKKLEGMLARNLEIGSE